MCEDTGLGFERTDEIVVVQIFQQGRTTEDKKVMFETLAERLESVCGVRKTDLIISCVENKKEDWSFGQGEAQFLTGKL